MKKKCIEYFGFTSTYRKGQRGFIHWIWIDWQRRGGYTKSPCHDTFFFYVFTYLGDTRDRYGIEIYTLVYTFPTIPYWRVATAIFVQTQLHQWK